MKRQSFQNLFGLSAIASVLALTGCGGSSSSDDGAPETKLSADATQYVFESKFVEDESAVSYGGQTARQAIINDLVGAIGSLTEDVAADVAANLDFYVRGNVDTTNHSYDAVNFIPGPTFGDISTGKNLKSKIAGGDGVGGGETSKLIDNEFFGWGVGDFTGTLPIELVDYFITQIDTLATDGDITVIGTVGGNVDIGVVTVDSKGRDFKQLVQKFLLGAVTFSQGTNDYLQTDFSAANAQDGDKPYTTAEHKWDEAFGYFGAARDYNDYTDLEIRADSGRPEYENGYHDLDNSGTIDLRAEINVGNSTNCAKRDLGSTTDVDYTKTVFDAFLLGRETLNNAANGTLTDEQITTIAAQAKIAAVTWEKCIAATVVHYINDVRNDDIGDGFTGDVFADVGSFTSLAKHWSEMKGFALGLQFSPYSPFRDGSVAGIDVEDLEEVLSLMGDAPVLADGSQNGVAATGTAADAVTAYKAALLTARNLLEEAYGFDSTDVAGW